MIKKNIVANLIGKFWSILSAFLFIPFYINFLGFESFSIISFTLVIAGFMAIFEGGLTSPLSREFALSQNSLQDKIRILKSLESVLFIIIGLSIFLIISLSDFIAFKWLNLSDFNPSKISFFFKNC
jgi:O-antigen/teichoic acid export membrane protein